jgi:hypothetical protein
MIALTFSTFYKEHQELRKSDKKGEEEEVNLVNKIINYLSYFLLLGRVYGLYLGAKLLLAIGIHPITTHNLPLDNHYLIHKTLT